MKPRRFFVEGVPLNPGKRLLNGRSARHLTRVLRLKAGERVVLFDGSGCEFPADILEVRRDQVSVQVGKGRRVDRESPLFLRLGLGICQPATMDLVIQKTSELGVDEIAPVRTERGQSWLGDKKGVSRYERWKRIAQEAARQSGRSKIPLILPKVDLSTELFRRSEAGLKLIFWEEEELGGLKEVLATARETQEVHILVGPEGGFSAREVEQAVHAGFRSISLGRRILRTETAAIAAVSLLQYELGDLGLLP